MGAQYANHARTMGFKRRRSPLDLQILVSRRPVDPDLQGFHEREYLTGYIAVFCCEHAVGYAMHYSRSHDTVIRVYDKAGNVIERRCVSDKFQGYADDVQARANRHFEV